MCLDQPEAPVTSLPHAAAYVDILRQAGAGVQNPKNMESLILDAVYQLVIESVIWVEIPTDV